MSPLLKRRLVKARLAGGVLQTVLVISVVITALISAIILLAYYRQGLLRQHAFTEELQRNAQSGLQYLLASEQLAYDRPFTLDLFGKGEDTVMVQRKKWGLFDVGQSIAQRGTHRAQTLAMWGALPDELGKIALYLVDENRPLSVAGTNQIIGDCYLPKAGLRTAYVNNTGFLGGQMVEGVVKESQVTLPPPNPIFLSRLALYQASHPPTEVQRVSHLPPQLIRSFGELPALYASDQELRIQDKVLQGQVMISSRRMIIVEASAQLDNVILMAPKVILKQGFRGSVQVFARDSIAVEENCQLRFPSVLAIYSDSSQAKMTIAKGCDIQGIIYVGGKENPRLGNMLKLGEGATLRGYVYVDGFVEHQGIIEGSLLCRRFFLATPSTLYENHLFNSVIDVTRRSRFWVTSPLLSTSKHNKIIRWLR